jgi:signal transduction histidine kinase
MLSTIRSDLKDNPPSELQSRILSQEEINSSMQLGYFRFPGTILQTRIFAMGYEYEKDYILSNMFPDILNSIDLGKDLYVGVLDIDDSLLYLQLNLPISNYLVAESFSRPLLNWKVALFDPEGKAVDQIVGYEQRLYLILFVGILFVMVVGIFIMVRAVVHESEVSRLKSEFVSSVSHELKTPLTLIRMFGETLDAGMVKDEKKRREFYSIIRKESERLSHLIDNVLDFSRMDTGAKKYHFKESDLVKVVRDSMEAYKFHIRDNGFEIESVLPDQEIELRIDRDAISQALLNLLSNAVKFSKDKKLIRVEVSQNTDSALISVSDHGVGIPKGELNKIFEKFYRVPATHIEEKTGSGLGLALVKHIVDAHNGTIDVQSELGKGSTFTIKIPFRWNSNK